MDSVVQKDTMRLTEREEAEMIRTREAWWINEVGDSGKNEREDNISPCNRLFFSSSHHYTHSERWAVKQHTM